MTDERCWLKGISEDPAIRQCVEMCAGFTNCEKKDVTSSKRSEQSSLRKNLEYTRQIHLKPCTLEESQRANYRGRKKTVYAVSCRYEDMQLKVNCVSLHLVNRRNVLRVLFFFLSPFIDLFRSSEPCSVVFQVISLCGMSFFVFH